MDMDYKSRIRKSIESFSVKNNNLPKKTRKKRNKNNEGPVVLEIKNGLEYIGWSVSIIESKAVFNSDAGRYLHGKTDPGYPDISGNTPNGLAVFIEVKDRGKRTTLKKHQMEFLIEKINTNCFAICADSLEYVKLVYNQWRQCDNKKALLLRELPKISFTEDTFDLS